MAAASLTHAHITQYDVILTPRKYDGDISNTHKHDNHVSNTHQIRRWYFSQAESIMTSYIRKYEDDVYHTQHMYINSLPGNMTTTSHTHKT